MKVCLLLLVFSFLTITVFAQKSTTNNTYTSYHFTTGNIPVGYRTITVTDKTRLYANGQPGKTAVHIWYPAFKTTAKVPFHFIKYVKAESAKQPVVAAADVLLTETTGTYTDTVNTSLVVAGLTNLQTIAVENAPVQKGKHKTIVLHSGINSPGFVQSLLAEYLASYGYVVVAFPPMMIQPNTQQSYNQESINTQIRDIELVLKKIVKLPFVDSNHITLTGWSFGGAVQILYQMKTNKAKLLISLDAASQYQYGWDLIKQSLYFKTSMNTPFVQLTSTAPKRYNIPLSTAFFDSVAIQKKQLLFPNTTHAQMLSFANLTGVFEKKQPDLAGFLLICEAVKNILAEYLHNIPQ
jgi:hypothetical protein